MNGGMKQPFLSQSQKNVQQYLLDHRIEEILGDMLNTIAHNKFEEPLVYMIKYLAKQVPKEILNSNGIQVENAEAVQAIIQIPYPVFDSSCTNIFKQIFTRQVYLECKNLQTEYNNNLRNIIQLGLENQKQRVGLFACDSSAEDTFKPMFNSAQSLLFPLTYPLPNGFEYQRKSDFKRTTPLNLEMKYIEEFSIKMKRNVASYSFNSTMKPCQREKVGNLISELMQNNIYKLFSTHLNISKIEAQDKNSYATQYNKLISDSSAFTRSGIRYNQWPHSRHILFSHNKKSMIWVNKEDHFELKCSGGKESNFIDSLVQCAIISQLVDEKINFSFDKKSGFSTVKPMYAGLGLKFKVKLKFPQSQASAFKSNLEICKKMMWPMFEIKQLKKDSHKWMITMRKTHGISSLADLIHNTEIFFTTLFISIVQQNQKENEINLSDMFVSTNKENLIDEIFSYPSSRQSHQQSQEQQQVQKCEKTSQKKEDSQEQDQKQLTSASKVVSLKQQQQQPINVDHIEIHIEDDSCSNEGEEIQMPPKKNVIEEFIKYKRIANYSENQEIIQYLIATQQKSVKLNQFYDIPQIVKSTTESVVILQSHSDPQQFILSSYIVMKRNFKSIPLKSQMREEHFKQSDQIMESIVKNSEVIRHSHPEYQNTIFKILKDYQLFDEEDSLEVVNKFDFSSYPYGTALFNSKDLKIISNLDDHLIIILKIIHDDLIESLLVIDKIIFNFIELMAKDQLYGYITRDPRISGSAIQIIYKLKDSQKKSIPITQTDEITSIVTKYLEKEKGVQIEIQNPDGDSLYQFVKDCNNHLLQIKLPSCKSQKQTDNLLCEEDCYDKNGRIIAPERECFTNFKTIYQKYLSTFNLKEDSLPAKRSSFALKFQDADKDILVHYQFRRNFEQFNFVKFLTWSQVNEIKSDFDKIFNKLIQFRKVETDWTQSYKSINYDHKELKYSVEILKIDHLSIISSCKLKELQKSIDQTFDLFAKMQTNKFSFLRDDDLGYLSEEGIGLGDNFQMKLEFCTMNDKLEQIEKIAKEYQYELMVDGQKYKRINFVQQQQQQLQYQPQKQQGEMRNVTLELKRCGFFLFEMEMIQRLNFALSDKLKKI